MIFEQMGNDDMALEIDDIPEVYWPLFLDIDTNQNKDLDYDEVFNAFKDHNIHIVGASTDVVDPTEPLPHIDPVPSLGHVDQQHVVVPLSIGFDVNLSDGAVAISNLSLE